MKTSIKIGLFDSGIGGFSILGELFKILPDAEYYYVSDDAFAPYGPKTDNEITQRGRVIVEALLEKNVDIVVVACNTATAASIDTLRNDFPRMSFVGVEPFLNAYYKVPDQEMAADRKMVVLTTESTGKSERFKRLKDRLDPDSQIDHFSLKNLAKLVENFYYNSSNPEQFENDIIQELSFLKGYNYKYAVLGCTHYPLIADKIEKILNLKTISPDKHIAERVKSLTTSGEREKSEEIDPHFYFLSTTNNIWTNKLRSTLYGPFKRG